MDRKLVLGWLVSTRPFQEWQFGWPLELTLLLCEFSPYYATVTQFFLLPCGQPIWVDFVYCVALRIYFVLSVCGSYISEILWKYAYILYQPPIPSEMARRVKHVIIRIQLLSCLPSSMRTPSGVVSIEGSKAKSVGAYHHPHPWRILLIIHPSRPAPTGR